MLRRALEKGVMFLTAPCARRTGKTVGLLFLMVEAQARTKGRFHAALISTDHAKAKEMHAAYLKVLGGDPKINSQSLVKTYRNDQGQDRWIEVKPLAVTDPDTGEQLIINTGGKVYFFSGQHPQYRAIQGFPFHFDIIAVDEMQLQVVPLVTEVVVPMLMDAGGRLVLTGHPKRGLPGNHLFHTYYNRGRSDDPKWAAYRSWNMVAEANPFVSEETLKMGRAACLTKEEEIEEYDGLFVADGGAVFKELEVYSPMEQELWPEWASRLVVRHPLPQATLSIGADRNRRHTYAVSVDWAKTQDATVIEVWDRVTNDQVCVARIRIHDYEDQLKWVHAIRHAYGGALTYGDETGVGAAMGERLKRNYKSGYRGIKFSSNSKELMVRRAQIYVNEGMVRFLDIPEQTEEFRLFAIIPPKSDDMMGGKNQAIRYGHPVGEHDDYVDSFLMVTEALAFGRRNPRPEQVQKPAVWTMDDFMDQDRAMRGSRNRPYRVGSARGM